MRKLLLSAAIVLTSLTAFADLQGDGYYRVQNAMTKRYVYLLDNKGSFNASAGSADVWALRLFMDKSNLYSDPSTVFYIDCVSGEGTNIVSCNIAGQGTSLYDFFSSYMKVMGSKNIDDQKSYFAYATKSGVSKYLGDRQRKLNVDEGYPDVDATGDYRLWYIDPIITDSEESYFGVAPTLTKGGKYYAPFYAAFPFKPYSEGMKVYAVGKVDAEHAVVVLKEVDGVVPGATPVIIECSNLLPAGNRLNIGGAGASVGDNFLKGVYFNNDIYGHVNQTPYNKKTMRILTESNGKLVFDVADIDFLPRNEAYLQLTGDKEYAVGKYTVLTEEEYKNAYDAVEVIEVDQPVDVYSLDGRLVESGILKADVPSLGKGLYILRSGGVSEKLIVR